MSRRRREEALAQLVASLLMLGALGWTFSPQFRQTVKDLFLIGFFLLFVLVAAVALYKYNEYYNRKREQNNFVSPYHPPLEPPEPVSPIQMLSLTPSKPATTDDLICQLRSIDWFQFEKVVAVTYRKLGYQVTRRGGANPDRGIDLIVEKDGQETAIQCKQWKTWNVGVKPIREFLGALTDAGLKNGIFVTLNGYTGDAKLLADKHYITIYNEMEFAGLLEKVDAHFDLEIQEALKDTTKYCPKCERIMVLRTAKRGSGLGSQFWGCSGYPKCRYTMPFNPPW